MDCTGLVDVEGQDGDTWTVPGRMVTHRLYRASGHRGRMVTYGLYQAGW